MAFKSPKFTDKSVYYPFVHCNRLSFLSSTCAGIRFGLATTTTAGSMQSLTFEQQLTEYLKQKQMTTTAAPLIRFPFDFKFQVAREFHILDFGFVHLLNLDSHVFVLLLVQNKTASKKPQVGARIGNL
jgi:hypothetical protein